MKIFCVNFGSTSTKIGAFDGDEQIFTKSYDVGKDGYPAKFANLDEHQAYAIDLFAGVLAEYGLSYEDFDVFVGRGGGQVFVTSGAFRINDIMIQDTYRLGNDAHPGKLGCRVAYALGQKYGKESYIVNPPCVDEFIDVARPTGFKEINRCSRNHALNQKEVGFRYAKDTGRDYNKLNLIICHMGGGISITAHRQGKMIDSNDIIEGDGPMAPTRCGSVPAIPLIDMCYSGKYTHDEMIRKCIKTAGLVAHLGTEDAREVEKRIAEGDKYAEVIYNAMIYQIAKYAGSMAVALKGKVDAVLFTGGMSRGEAFCEKLKDYLGFLGCDFARYPGEFEIQALAAGVVRALEGDEPVHEYTGEDVWQGFEGVE